MSSPQEWAIIAFHIGETTQIVALAAVALRAVALRAVARRAQHVGGHPC
jgi:hypothetical protein